MHDHRFGPTLTEMTTEVRREPSEHGPVTVIGDRIEGNGGAREVKHQRGFFASNGSSVVAVRVRSDDLKGCAKTELEVTRMPRRWRKRGNGIVKKGAKLRCRKIGHLREGGVCRVAQGRNHWAPHLPIPR